MRTTFARVSIAAALAAVSACAGTARDTPPILLIDDAVSGGLLKAGERWTDSFEWSRSPRVIRALVPFNKIYCYVDGPEMSGLAVDTLRAFQLALRDKAPRMTTAPAIVLIPTRHDRMMAALEEGAGDIAVAALGVTDNRGKQVDFSLPTNSGIRDLVVSGPSSPKTATVDDLSGQLLFVRRSSSSYEAVEELNRRLVTAGRAPARLAAADDLLEDEDVLQMVDAGIYPATVARDYLAAALTPIYDRLTIRRDLIVKDKVSTVVAIRKGQGLLRQLVDEWVEGHRIGTTNYGDAVMKKHLGNTARLRNPTADEDLKNFRTVAADLQKLGAEARLEWLLAAAQGYEDDKADAAGVSARMASLRSAIDTDYRDAPGDRLNKSLFALASQRAGRDVMKDWRARTSAAGLDPNVWFYNVEIIAAHRSGRATVDYLRRIYEYYVAYQTVTQPPA